MPTSYKTVVYNLKIDIYDLKEVLLCTFKMLQIKEQSSIIKMHIALTLLSIYYVLGFLLSSFIDILFHCYKNFAG